MARPILKKGMSGKKGTEIGEAILLWRLFLGKPELKPAEGTTVYDFGAASDKFTREFQKSIGLPQTGIVDANTWASYDSRMSSAPPVVQNVAKAVENQGEANKAAAMAAAVTKAAAAKANAAAPKPPLTPAAVKTVVQAKAKEAAATVQTAVKTAVTHAQVAKDNLHPWQRMLAGGLLALGGLVGFKALRGK